MKHYYGVLVLRHWDSLEVLGMQLSLEQDAPGCIGFFPVFRTKEEAEAWCAENNFQEARIFAVEGV